MIHDFVRRQRAAELSSGDAAVGVVICAITHMILWQVVQDILRTRRVIGGFLSDSNAEEADFRYEYHHRFDEFHEVVQDEKEEARFPQHNKAMCVLWLYVRRRFAILLPPIGLYLFVTSLARSVGKVRNISMQVIVRDVQAHHHISKPP